MEQHFKRLIATLLSMAMAVSLTFGNASFAVLADEENNEYAVCITRKDGVAAEESATTYIYNGFKPNLGNKFMDTLGHTMSYYESRSVYNSESDSWSEASAYEEIQVGFASSLSEYAVTEDTPGVYRYTWKAYCKSEGKLSEESYTVTLTVTDPEETVYDMTFYVGRDVAGANFNPVIKLYPTSGADDKTGYDTFEESEEIKLEGGKLDAAGQYRVYTASLKGGAYSYRAWGFDSATGDYTTFLGGMSVRIPMASNVTQPGYDASSVYIKTTTVSTRTKYDGTNYLNADQYTTEVVCPYYNCTATPGTPYVANDMTYYPYMLVAQGNACLYNYYAYPTEKVAESYDLIFGYGINATVQKGYTITSWTPSVATRITSAITVPEGAEAEVFFQMNNFRDMEIESYDKKVHEDGTVTWYFYVPRNNSNYTYRVSKEGYVTKAGYMSLGSAESASFTVMLDRTDVKSHDFSNLGSTVATRDEANLIMNVNDQNAKYLDVNETFRLRAYRIWEIINSDAGNIMIEPDFHYQVLSGEEVVSVTKVENNLTNGKGNWLDIKGICEGTAVIAVTYDAIEVDGASGHGGFFPAISPERTGIVVIHVGEHTSDIQDLGIKNASGSAWSWNYDTFYYIAPDTEGVLDIIPQAASGIADVEVAVVSTSEKMTSTLGTWKKVAADDDGYKVPIMAGNNVIKITSGNGSVAYQVVRGAQLNVFMDNVTNPGEKIMPGNTVKLSFDGLYRTIPKISGVFNPVTLEVIGTGSDGILYKGSFGQYQVADKAAVEVTIPEDISFEEGREETEYTISGGYMNLSFMYAYADAWKFMYTLTDAGIGTCFNAVNNPGKHTTILDIHIPVYQTVTFDVAYNVTDESGVKLEDYTLTVTDRSGNKIEDFSSMKYGVYDYHIEKDGYVVKDDSFTLGSATDAEDGKTTVDIVLTKASENAWDGKSMTEPEQDADGTYLIGTGAELAWFANAVNESGAKTTSTKNAKLTADIDLANYPWMQIGYYTSTADYVYYGGCFDGAGYRIRNFRMKKQTTTTTAFYAGLFAYTSGAVIQNLTVDGTVVIGSTASVSNAYSGGIVGYALNTTFENVTSNVDVTTHREKGNFGYVGGVSGYSKGTTTYNHVTNNGNITGYTYVGGITGFTESTISDAVNTGAVSGYTFVAGITGVAAAELEISNVCNQGEIFGTTNVAGIAAGIIKANVKLIKSINEGNVTAANGTVGGIIASSSYMFTASYCINLGDITGGKNGYTGGIAGNISATVQEEFDNCVSFGTVISEKAGNVGDLIGYAKCAIVKNCAAQNGFGSIIGTSTDQVELTQCVLGNTKEEVLYAYATGKTFEEHTETAVAALQEKLSSYLAVLQNRDKTVAEKLEILEQLKTEVNFERIILGSEIVTVTVSAQADNAFIAVPKEITVNGYTAEAYGYTDSVTDGVSALDILTAVHVSVYGHNFNPVTEKEYLNLSAGSYGSFVSKAFGRDGNRFMFSVNGMAPHNNTLENGYYTGYTVDWTKVENGDRVAFYFAQDADYNDSITWFETEKTTIEEGKALTLSLKGYNYLWYGCCAEEVIRAHTAAISGACLYILNESTGALVPLADSMTDEKGMADVIFDKAGTYLITANVSLEEATPIFMPVISVTVKEAKEEETSTEEATTAKGSDKETTTAAQETTGKIAPTTRPVTVKKTNVKSAVKKKKATTAKVSLKKVKGAAGYIVKVSTSKKFKKRVTIRRKYQKVKFTIRKLKANKVYYIKARTYRKVNGKVYYSAWSKVKKIKLKK